MLDSSKVRRTEVKQGDAWISAQMGQLEPGDIFRMFEPDGTPVADGKAFVVRDLPHVKCDPVEAS